MKKEVTLLRILTNAAIIATVIIVIAIAAHFVLRAATRHGARRIVPEFKGISLREAELLAQERDLNIFINDSLYVTAYAGGTVLDQLPASGVEVKPGRTVYIVINAFGDRMVEVPYVAGYSLRQAKNMLDVAGLEIGKISYTPDMATNYVLKQSFEGRAIDVSSDLQAAVGSGIDLTVGVSEKDPYTLTPNVIGLSLKEAKSRIWLSGMNVGRIDMDEGVNPLKQNSAKVYIQGVAANSSARWGSSMSITLTLDEAKINNATAAAHKAELEYEKALLEAKENPEALEEEEEQSDEFFD